MAKDHLIHAEASRLAAMGYALVPCHRHEKRPRTGSGWQRPENLVTDKAGVQTWFGNTDSNLGIHLLSSGLCSIDLDEPELARDLFTELGMDVEVVMDSGCRISGGPGRSRSMFRVPDGAVFPSVKYTVTAGVARAKGLKVKAEAKETDRVTVFELRGGSANSQDILPPSIHPKGLHRYRYLNEPLKRREEMPLPPVPILNMWRNWENTCQRFNAYLGMTTGAVVHRPAEAEKPPSPTNAPAPSIDKFALAALVEQVFDFSSLEAAPGDELTVAPPPRPADQVGGYKDIAQLFSEQRGHDFAELLARNGYELKGHNRWLAPGSSTGEPGVHLAKDGLHVFSYHGDALGGEYTDGHGMPHPIPRDYFDCWCQLEHGGNKVAAIRAAKAELGVALATRDFGAASSSDHLQAIEVALSDTQARGAQRPSGAFNAPPLIGYTYEELRNMPPTKWLIKGVLPRGGLGCIYGVSGVGKSFVVLDLGLAIARGIPWQEHRVEQAGVLYIAAEGGSGFFERMNAYVIHHKAELAATPFVLVKGGVDLLSSAAVDVKRILDLCKARLPGGVGLVVLDTLNRVMPGGNENAPDDMGTLISAASQIAEKTGAFVLIVHHPGKDSDKGARGHSSLRAAMDTEIEVKKAGDIRLVEIRKQRDGADDLRFAFTLEMVNLGIADEETLEPVRVPVAVAAALPAQKPGEKTGRPKIWEDIASTCAIDVFKNENSIGLDLLLSRMATLYQTQEGKPAPARFRDSAMRAIKDIESHELIRIEKDMVHPGILF